MRYLAYEEALELHRRILEQSGGAAGIRDLNAIDSALAQPQMMFGGEELYASIEEKAGALGFSLIKNHSFLDGNKRIGHAVMETFLMLNGFEIEASVDDQERLILGLASSQLSRDDLVEWLRIHIVKSASDHP